jgi:predicted SAM-dependent methyltransferase
MYICIYKYIYIYIYILRAAASLSRAHALSQVYMSHTLEHIDYMDALQPTLQEIARVIRPGGMFKCSVPDLAILCQMFLNLQGDDTDDIDYSITVVGLF